MKAALHLGWGGTLNVAGVLGALNAMVKGWAVAYLKHTIEYIFADMPCTPDEHSFLFFIADFFFITIIITINYNIFIVVL